MNLDILNIEQTIKERRDIRKGFAIIVSTLKINFINFNITINILTIFIEGLRSKR